MIPAYLKIEYRSVPRYERIASLLTVHNLSYQGQFWHWDMLLTGLDWKYFNWHQMEFHGNLNLLKTGMVFADSINTVSPRYAQEIQSSPLGCGLEGVLQYRHDVLSGILNGIDPHEWDPAADPHLAANYNADTWSQGKPVCKAALQKELGLPQEPAAPLVGMVGRLIDQKGFDLVADAMQRWVQTSDVQWVILGTGQPKYHKLLETLAERFPQRVALAAGVLQSAGPSHRGRRRHLPHAQPLRALRAEPAVQPAVWHGAAGARHRRAGRYDCRLRSAVAQRGRQRFCVPRVQSVGVERVLAPGLRRLSPAGLVEARSWRWAWARIGRGPAAQNNTWSCIRRPWSEGTE